jgi:hypothetical protein
MSKQAKRLVICLLMASGVGGCVYAPPNGAYYPYYNYGPPVYGPPPVSLDLGFDFYESRGGRWRDDRGGRGWGGDRWGDGRWGRGDGGGGDWGRGNWEGRGGRH